MTTLGTAEQKLLAWLIAEESVGPDAPFIVLRVLSGMFIAHGQMGTRKQVSDPALHRLQASGALLPRSFHEGMMQSFVLSGDATAMLQAAREGRGEPAPLAKAQEQIAGLEAEAVATTARHQAVADQVGGWVRGAVLMLLVAVIVGLVLWAFLANTLLPGLLAGVLVVYAVVTDALGYTAASAAKKAGDAVSRRLMRALERPPD